MTTEESSTALRWHEIRRTKLTSEYFGGVLVGFGLGGMVTVYLATKGIVGDSPIDPRIMIPAFILIAVGSGLAYRSQVNRQHGTGAM